VADIGADLRAEDDADERAGAAIEDDEGGAGIEGAAAGEADDVIEEAERAGEGAVLIVDFGVDVAAIGGGDNGGGGLVLIFGPGAKFEFGGEGRRGFCAISNFMKTRGCLLKPWARKGRATAPVS
jgi:hypothetical protein